MFLISDCVHDSFYIRIQHGNLHNAKSVIQRLLPNGHFVCRFIFIFMQRRQALDSIAIFKSAESHTTNPSDKGTHTLIQPHTSQQYYDSIIRFIKMRKKLAPQMPIIREFEWFL